jgi:hypothetical protein
MKPKDKKNLLKTFKGFFLKAAQEEFGHLALLKIIETTDDTVLTTKTLFTELNQTIEDCIFHKYAKLCYLDILAPNSKMFFSEATRKFLNVEKYNENVSNFSWKKNDKIQLENEKKGKPQENVENEGKKEEEAKNEMEDAQNGKEEGNESEEEDEIDEMEVNDKKTPLFMGR